MSSKIISILSLLIACLGLASAQDVCQRDGQVFQRGEAMGSTVITRCDGKPEEFPCYCNPGTNSVFDFVCPYCSFATEDGTVKCAKDAETVSFTNLDGEAQTCQCSVDNIYATPVSTCESGITISNGGEQGGGQDDTDSFVGQTRTDTCSIELPSGETRIFRRGESLHAALPNRCKKAEDFPCVCNPDLPEQIECSYCRFAAEGGELICARDGETVNYRDLDGVNQSCECSIPEDPTQRFQATCTADGIDPSDNNNDVCTLELDDGSFKTFQNGESYGEYLETRCGPTDQWPCFCDPSLPGQAYCPYCGFVDGDNQLFCAKDKGEVTFEDAGLFRTCTCDFPEDRLGKPAKQCTTSLEPPQPGDNGSENNVCILEIEGLEIAFVEGESFGGLIEGVCGTPDLYPSFCRPKKTPSTDGTTTRQDDGSPNISGEEVEYPYCVFSDTQSGDTVCAKDNEDVVYVNSEGVEVICTCLVAPPELGGAESLCRPNGATTNRPTPPVITTPSPTPPPTNGERGAPTGDGDDDSASLHSRSTVLCISATLAAMIWTVL